MQRTGRRDYLILKAVGTEIAKRISKRVKPLLPLAAGLAGCCVSAHAGPVNNALTSVGVDVTDSAAYLGSALILWQGVRVLMDEHHSVNPGRIAGTVAGSLLIFGRDSIGTWASGW